MAVLKHWSVSAGLDDLFVDHYAQLMSWAHLLVGPDPGAAQDLVHDTFVRVALRNPDLRAVDNIQGYLFVTMRNVHLSGVRRQVARPEEVSSFLDFDTVRASLNAAGAHSQRQAAYEELILVARYACIRKATSKAASALILRFFHGYHPSEIARVLRTTDGAVDARLRMARAEAQAYVAGPDRLTSFDDRRAVHPASVPVSDEADFVAALRRAIFAATVGECLNRQDMERVYAGSSPDPLDAGTLAHIVSCAACLDAVNRTLGLPLLRDRDPSDMLGRGGRRGGPKGGASGPASDPKAALRTRLNDVLDDRPKELRIAVNGLFVGSQAVSGLMSEQRVKILINERIGFIEVFSGHGTCLLYLDVEPPPDGPVRQAVRVALSHGRTLSATLTFHDAAPVLDVVYEDLAGGEDLAISAQGPQTLLRLARSHGGWWRRLLDGLRVHAPIALAATVALAATAGWVWTARSVSRVSASEVLKSVRAAESGAVRPGTATRRLITVEERVLPASKPVRVQRLESWRDDTRGLKVQRLFDERSHVVAGLWTKADGSRTVYRAGARPVTHAASQPAEPAMSQNMWTHEPSAGDFVVLVGAAATPAVEERDDSYVLSYRQSPAPVAGVIEATLTVAKADHRATGETVTLREAGEIHEFTFSETDLEQLPAESVAPHVFEPEADLLGEPIAMVPAPPAVAPAPPPVVARAPALAVADLDRLELDATYRLYRARIWLGQQASLVRTPGGLRITARVPDEAQESRVKRSFEELAGNAAVWLEVQVDGGASAAETGVLDQTVISTLPVYPALQSPFAPTVPAVARDEAIHSFVGGILENVRRRDDRLKALSVLIERWPEDRVRSLNLEAVVTWQLMLQEHADAIRQQTEFLRLQIAAWFMTAAAPPETGRDGPQSLSSVSAAADAASQLVRLAREQDELLRAALSPCQSAPCAPLDVNRLVRSFTALESTAARFVRFHLKAGPDPGRQPAPMAESFPGDRQFVGWLKEEDRR